MMKRITIILLALAFMSCEENEVDYNLHDQIQGEWLDHHPVLKISGLCRGVLIGDSTFQRQTFARTPTGELVCNMDNSRTDRLKIINGNNLVNKILLNISPLDMWFDADTLKIGFSPNEPAIFLLLRRH